MAIIVNDGFENRSNKPISVFYLNGSRPWDSVVNARLTIPMSYRHMGMTVLVGRTAFLEYWWKDGVEDGNLVLKTTSSTGGDSTEVPLENWNASTQGSSIPASTTSSRRVVIYRPPPSGAPPAPTAFFITLPGAGVAVEGAVQEFLNTTGFLTLEVTDASNGNIQAVWQFPAGANVKYVYSSIKGWVPAWDYGLYNHGSSAGYHHDTTGQAGTVSAITGLVTGSAVTGSGTEDVPYVINSTGGGGAGVTVTTPPIQGGDAYQMLPTVSESASLVAQGPLDWAEVLLPSIATSVAGQRKWVTTNQALKTLVVGSQDGTTHTHVSRLSPGEVWEFVFAGGRWNIVPVGRGEMEVIPAQVTEGNADNSFLRDFIDEQMDLTVVEGPNPANFVTISLPAPDFSVMGQRKLIRAMQSIPKIWVHSRDEATIYRQGRMEQGAIWEFVFGPGGWAWVRPPMVTTVITLPHGEHYRSLDLVDEHVDLSYGAIATPQNFPGVSLPHPDHSVVGQRKWIRAVGYMAKVWVYSEDENIIYKDAPMQNGDVWEFVCQPGGWVHVAPSMVLSVKTLADGNTFDFLQNADEQVDLSVNTPSPSLIQGALPSPQHSVLGQRKWVRAKSAGIVLRVTTDGVTLRDEEMANGDIWEFVFSGSWTVANATGGGGGGDVTEAGDNNFSGTNTFQGNTVFGVNGGALETSTFYSTVYLNSGTTFGGISTVTMNASIIVDGGLSVTGNGSFSVGGTLATFNNATIDLKGTTRIQCTNTVTFDAVSNSAANFRAALVAAGLSANNEFTGDNTFVSAAFVQNFIQAFKIDPYYTYDTTPWGGLNTTTGELHLVGNALIGSATIGTLAADQLNVMYGMDVENGAGLTFYDPDTKADWRKSLDVSVGLIDPWTTNVSLVELGPSNTMSSKVVEGNFTNPTSVNVVDLDAIKVGDVWEVCQIGTGPLNVTATTSVAGQVVTLQFPPNGGPATGGQFSSIFIRCREKGAGTLDTATATLLVTGGVPVTGGLLPALPDVDPPTDIITRDEGGDQ